MADQESVFGSFFGVYDIDECIIDLYKQWAQTYLNEVARRTGEPFARMRAPRSYRASHEVEFMPEDQRPCVVVACVTPDEPLYIAGASPGPSEYGKVITMAWTYDIGVQVVAQGSKKSSIPRAHRLAMLYTTALRLALIQAETDLTKKLNWFVDWRGEAPDILDSDADRTTCVGVSHYLISVPAAAVRDGGPLIPEEDPLDQSPTWPVIQTPVLDIEKWPTEQPFPDE